MTVMLLGCESLPPHTRGDVTHCWQRCIPLSLCRCVACELVSVEHRLLNGAAGWVCVNSLDLPVPVATPAPSSLVLPRDRGWTFVLPLLTYMPVAAAWGPQQLCVEQPGIVSARQPCHWGQKLFFRKRRKDYEVNVACDSCVPVLFVLCQIPNRCFSSKNGVLKL